jgi:hypothetical protein
MNDAPSEFTAREKRWLKVFERIEVIRAFYQMSAVDVTRAVKNLKRQPASQFWRRTVVRNFAAHVEAFLYVLKQTTLALSDLSSAKFDKRELAFLADVRRYTDEAGNEIDLDFPKFVENLKFAFASYARVNGSAFKLDCGDHRYDYFQAMVKVRNRLTHPKSIARFDVSDQETVWIAKAWGWYQEQGGKLLTTEGSRSLFQTKLQGSESCGALAASRSEFCSKSDTRS